MKNLDFSTDKESLMLIDMIVGRYADFYSKFHKGQSFNRMHLVMDLLLAHKSNPLQLWELLHATDEDFTHDISGIIQHLDRATGELRDLFSPRYTKGGCKKKRYE